MPAGNPIVADFLSQVDVASMSAGPEGQQNRARPLGAGLWLVAALLLSVVWLGCESFQVRPLSVVASKAEAILEDRKRYPRARPNSALSLAALKTTLPRNKPRALASGGTPDAILARTFEVGLVRFGETRGPAGGSAPELPLSRAFQARGPPSAIA